MYVLLVVFLVFLQLLAPITDACLGSGICGGGGCAPPPVCAPACGAGFGCGHYGCYRLRTRARAASSKTLKIDKSLAYLKGSEAEELEQPQTPDQKFMACCIERNLPDSCLEKCSFATFTRAALQNMFVRVDSCPVQAAADIQYCAAQGKDHRECCVRNGVTTTLAGEKCLTFCDQRPGNVTQLDFSYMSCYERFENMKGCFWHDSMASDAYTKQLDYARGQAVGRAR